MNTELSVAAAADVPTKEQEAAHAACLASEAKKQASVPAQRKVFVVKPGSEIVDEKCYMMAHVMCSMSASTNGCGAVFWAAHSEFRLTERTIEQPNGGTSVIYGCLMTECPECGHQVGGLDVEFKMLSAQWVRKRFGVDIEQPTAEYFTGKRDQPSEPDKLKV